VPGSGVDTISTAPRVGGARIAAFRVLSGGGSASPTLGPEVAAVLTGSDGKFTTPALEGGEYVFTITPPSGSIYQGVWVTTLIHPESSVYPWWVVLARK
jgi:hypothetical protein